jgi:hypothetical protein
MSRFVGRESNFVVGRVPTILEELQISDNAHNMMIYSSRDSYREFYSQFSRDNLRRNRLVMILPFNDHASTVKHDISKYLPNVDNYQRNGSLKILDARVVYSDWQKGAIPLVMNAMAEAEEAGKEGVSIIGELGLYYKFEKIEELVNYEKSAPKKFDAKLDAICVHSKGDINRLSPNERAALFDCHSRTLVLK